jgi:hypothetical protein
LAERGKLVALEGFRKADLVAGGKRLLTQHSTPKTAGGVSVWDNSGIFYELGRARFKDGVPSAKTLLMLYAADLAFRLRWEIEPLLKEGLTVVAAPYVETALGVARAAGIDAAWAADLFRFAPKPDAVFRLHERDELSYWKAKVTTGFVDFCCAALAAGSDEWHQGEVREAVIKYLSKREKRGKIATFKSKAGGK